MPAPKHRQGQARIIYEAAVMAEPGIMTVDLAARFGVTRDSVTMVLTPALRAGRLERSRPGTGLPVRWYPAGQMPSPDSVLCRRIVDYVRSRAGDGALAEDLCMAVSRGKSMVYIKLDQLRRDGKVVSLRQPPGSAGTGQSPKRWFVPEFAPAELPRDEKPLPSEKAKSKALTLDPFAPAIIPEGVRFIVAEKPRGRFDIETPPGWVGQITRDWREARLGGML